ncbi:MAG TPA: RNA 3'-terminal phosphate cyclase [Chthonomonadaceae bacterium]|nr:RNA 3'-terminal phosphate cyclase [Chthonomonadaceae bacterium]
MAAADRQPVWIDGAFGEGGGQILRTSVSLAALTGRPVEIAHIRARRSKPGLQAQHLTAVRAAAALCSARLQGDRLGSSFLRFVPGALTSRDHFLIDVAEARGGASAGATGLVAQTLLVPMAFLPAAGAAATLRGGTHVPMAPPADYIEAVYVPMLRRMGLEADLSLTRAGFYPRGGGEITFRVLSGRPEVPVDCVERGRLKRLRVFIVTSQLPEHVAARGKETALKGLAGYGVEVEAEVRDLPSHGPGAAVVVVAECTIGSGGWTGLGERGKPMERVAEEAVRGFKEWFSTGAGVDEHLADQLVLPCALIPQVSRWTTPQITEHLRTALWVAQQFLPIETTLETRADGSGLVTLRGVSPPE